MSLAFALRITCAAMVAWILGISPALGQPPARAIDPDRSPIRGAEPTPPRPRKVEQPMPRQRHDAGSVSGAPTSDRASGILRPESRSSTARTVARVLLLPPRAAFWLLNAPVRGSFWAYHRYDLRGRTRHLLFNEDGTAGVWPVASAETDFGLHLGARFLHRDAAGRDERITVHAGHGGRFQPRLGAGIDSGKRLGRVRLGVDLQLEDRPEELFYGLGDRDEVADVDMPVDPATTAVASRYRHLSSRGRLAGELRLVGPLSTRLSSALVWRQIDSSDGARDIASQYQTDSLVGFGQEDAFLYHEARLVLDTRAPTGVLVGGFAGAQATDQLRYGGEAEARAALGSTRRMLVVRAQAESVAGDQIPFVDLPSLGGTVLLRGHAQDRFRDRAAALGSAEYRFAVLGSLDGFLFADAGRVAPSLADLTGGGIRAGYGGGLRLHAGGTYLGRLSIASSIDGGLFLAATFDPFHDPGETR
jgi:hypothetical protein